MARSLAYDMYEYEDVWCATGVFDSLVELYQLVTLGLIEGWRRKPVA